MRLAPTLYYLIFRKANAEMGIGDIYDVYETHCGQEKGCFMSDENYLCSCSRDEIHKTIKEFEDSLIEGRLDGVEVEK